jgi:tetratricopeptide (TPR) repeat protein
MNRVGDYILGILVLVVFVGVVGWLFWRWFRGSEEPLRLVWKWGITAFLLGVLVVKLIPAMLSSGYAGAFLMIFVAVIGIIIGCLWAPDVGEWFSKFFTGLYDGGATEPDPQALYSIAEARRKQGRYREAIAEARSQMARFPDDFTGQMFQAEILAEDLKDLQGAEAIVNAVVSQTRHARRNVAHALNSLADWQIRLSEDPGAARETLRRIVELYPGAEEAWMANQRLAHLGGTRRHDPTRERPRIHLERHEEYIGLRPDYQGLKIPGTDPAELESGLLRHLEEYPLDAGAREDLVALYAGRMERVDLAREQIELFLATPDLPFRQVIHWLDLLTDLHAQHTNSLEAAREAQQRIIDLYPQTAAAENALKRMAYLKLEMKGKETRQSIKLGVYEQDIGLRKPGP